MQKFHGLANTSTTATATMMCHTLMLRRVFAWRGSCKNTRGSISSNVVVLTLLTGAGGTRVVAFIRVTRLAIPFWQRSHYTPLGSPGHIGMSLALLRRLGRPSVNPFAHLTHELVVRDRRLGPAVAGVPAGNNKLVFRNVLHDLFGRLISV
jgi:hypothetical protein